MSSPPKRDAEEEVQPSPSTPTHLGPDPRGYRCSYCSQTIAVLPGYGQGSTGNPRGYLQTCRRRRRKVKARVQNETKTRRECSRCPPPYARGPRLPRLVVDAAVSATNTISIVRRVGSKQCREPAEVASNMSPTTEKGESEGLERDDREVQPLPSTPPQSRDRKSVV